MNALTSSNDLVDQARPWLGLASFSETTRAYFHGRDEEVAELARRVQRKLLTVLFGQSGLGKTSILRAGLVPRLRAQGYCPVYVRIDYAADAPSPAVQVKRAIAAAAPLSGIDGDDESSLWELLHRRESVLRDADGQQVAPLLILDQFEEIFTLAQGDAAGRRKATAFIDELAALVENRPPREVEERIDQDDSLVDCFDFAREDYRVLIALREDYLAHLEQLRRAMPSLTQNRMRLAPMSGPQAMAAVTGPGGRLVNEEVAAAIVRFVANGAELAHAQVEPSLLSLICRELNEARIAAGRGEISLDLLAGSHASILSDFYERALAGYPPSVRMVVEDILLTGSGFRENVAEERVMHALSDAGAPPGTLADLVDRRLLRIEERLDIRRVELTHDVLCSVVRSSRDQRRERELLEEGERALAARAQREASARRSLKRTRQVAAACITLAVAALGASGYAYLATQRAKASIITAHHIQSDSDQARRQAEQLTAYLLDDFSRELSGTSRQQMFVDLGKTVEQYYDALPDIAPNSDTELYRALAQVTYADALVRQSKHAQARQVLAQALATLERRRKVMAPSEKNDIALARAMLAMNQLYYADTNFAAGGKVAGQVVAMLKPRMAQPAPSLALQRQYSKALLEFGAGYVLFSEVEQARPVLAQARAAYRKLLAITPGDMATPLDYASTLAQSADNEVRDRKGESGIAYLLEALPYTDKVLAAQPNHVIALVQRAQLNEGLGGIYAAGHTPDRSLPYYRLADQDYARGMQLDPASIEIVYGMLSNAQEWADLLYNAGRIPEALALTRKAAVPAETRGVNNGVLGDVYIKLKLLQASLHMELGDLPSATQDIASAKKTMDEIFAHSPDKVRTFFDSLVTRRRAELAIAHGDYATGAGLASDYFERTKSVKKEALWGTDALRRVAGDALYRAGKATDAELMLRPVVTDRLASPLADPAKITAPDVSFFTLYALTLDSMGRSNELKPIAKSLAAFVKTYGVADNHRPQRDYILAKAWLTIALASSGGERKSALAAATGHLRRVPPEVARLRSVQEFTRVLHGFDAPAKGGRPDA